MGQETHHGVPCSLQEGIIGNKQPKQPWKVIVKAMIQDNPDHDVYLSKYTMCLYIFFLICIHIFLHYCMYMFVIY